MTPLIILLTIFLATLFVLYRFFDKHSDDAAGFTVFLGLPIALLVSAATFVGLFEVENVNCLKVQQIGGCNRSRCGVLLDNGQKTELSAPVLGQEVCGKKYNFRF